jgi:uncharacterized protein (TIGR02246 family)
MQIGAWLAFVILAAVVSGAAAQQAAPAADTGVVALLRKHDEAMKRQDIDAIMALFAPGEKTVMIGTGPGERWVGKDEIRSAYVEFFKDFDKGSLTRTCEWTTGEVRKETAWGVAMCSMSDSLKDRKRDYELNVSAVAASQRGQWVFRSLHFSNLTGPAPPPAK